MPGVFDAQMQVLRWSRNAGEDVLFRAEPLCRTLDGNEVPLLTVTAKDTKQNPIQVRLWYSGLPEGFPPSFQPGVLTSWRYSLLRAAPCCTSRPACIPERATRHT